jgi:magnesium chelatase family protein
MHAKIHTAAIHGIEAIAVEIEVDIGRGLPGVTLLGLPDRGVSEGRDRVRAALRASGFEFPPHKVTVNLAPSHVRKEGPSFDLPLALVLLVATGQLDGASAARLSRASVVGELALDGRVRPVRGALAMAIAARRAGKERLILPAENAPEAAVIEGVEAIPVAHVREAVSYASGGVRIAPASPRADAPPAREEDALDMAEVRGQACARRAAVISAAGGHNLLLCGPPGSGKTMVARRLPSLLPDLDAEGALEVTRIWSAAGLLPPGAGLIRRPPFRAPHHSTSPAALVGGGSHVLRAGEATLAHRGILFLDELPEFDRRALETLRQPLEEGTIRIARACGALDLPASVLCVAAMNPCRCGRLGDARRPCECTPLDIQRYRGRVSGPLRDRFDLQLEVPPARVGEVRAGPSGPSSADLRREVEAARARQAARGCLNARLGAADLRRHASLDDAGEEALRRAAEHGGLSARAVTRVLRVARTIADLAGEDRIRVDHILEAVQFRISEPEGEGRLRCA